MTDLLPEVRVCVYGGRNYRDRAAVWRACDAVLAKHPGMILVSGMCGVDDGTEYTEIEKSADAISVAWARCRGVPVDPFPARWEEHGRKAGPIRNRQMGSSGLAGAVEFPGGAGTAHMRAVCKAHGVPVWRPPWA